MNGSYRFQEDRREAIALLGGLYFKPKIRGTKHLKALEQELFFQLAVFEWDLLIRNYGRSEILKRIEAATPSGQKPPDREMRAFAIASKYFAQGDRPLA